MVIAGLRWTVSTLARWGLGAGLLVSFTASAGIDATTGYSAASPVRFIEAAAFRAEPPAAGVLLLDPFSLGALDATDPVVLSGLLPDEASPRFETKNGLPAPHGIDRRAKYDAEESALLRRTLRLREEARAILYSGEAAGRGPGILQPSDLFDSTGLPGRFRTETPPSESAFVRRSSPTPVHADPRSAVLDGATPPLSGAVSGSTTTPASIDPMLRRIFASTTPGSRGERDRWSTGIFPLATLPDRARFASLIDPARAEAEQKCLAQAIYFEARSEPLPGQAAVAQVIFNRMKSGMYPTTACAVVFQNTERFLACEFTFTCEGKSLDVTDAASWATAVRLAKDVTEGRIYHPGVGDATHYHADYVNPRWAAWLEKLDVIGRHIFYKVKPDIPGGVCPGCLITRTADTRTPRG